MNKSTSTSNLYDFLHYAARLKKDLSKWQFFHLNTAEGQGVVKMPELIQSLEFHVQSKDSWLHVVPESNQFFLLSPKTESIMVSKFEKAVSENFHSMALRTRTRALDGDGMEQLGTLLAPTIDTQDAVAVLLHQRMKRMANSIMILDDDLMVTRQMEKALSGYGRVTVLNAPERFFATYKDCAPDVLFLDIHLKTAKGNELLRQLRMSSDPYAHVVIISSDTQQQLVHDIKESGARGFIVKPINRNAALQAVMKSPTTISKT